MLEFILTGYGRYLNLLRWITTIGGNLTMLIIFEAFVFALHFEQLYSSTNYSSSLKSLKQSSIYAFFDFAY